MSWNTTTAKNIRAREERGGAGKLRKYSKGESLCQVHGERERERGREGGVVPKQKL